MKKIFILILFLFSGKALSATAGDYYNAGMTYYQQRDFGKAVPYFKAAIQLDPKQWQSYQYLGQAYDFLKQYGEAYDALNKSLDINPANPPVQRLVAQLTPLVMAPPMPPEKKSKGKGPSGKPEGPPMAPRMWIKVTSKFDYSLEGDFNKAVAGWNFMTNQAGAAHSKASAGNWGVGAKLEGGNALDSENAMILTVQAFQEDGFTGNADSAGTTIRETVYPLVVGLELDFCHFWPQEKNRFYVKAGVGYYYAFVAFDQTVTGSFGNYYSASGTLGNGDFGFNLGSGYELMMEDNLGLEISVGFRYAMISQIVGPVTDGTVAGLAVLPNGYMGIADTRAIGGSDGSKFATLDLTGVEAGISLDFYLF